MAKPEHALYALKREGGGALASALGGGAREHEGGRGQRVGAEGVETEGGLEWDSGEAGPSGERGSPSEGRTVASGRGQSDWVV